VTHHACKIDSPVGKLLLISDGTALTALYTERSRNLPSPEVSEQDAVLALTARQLDEYFSGDRREFDLPLAPEGTDFERRVWAELLKIPYGATDTYGAISTRLGMKHGARAVGLANGRNPISIIVPCHRVIGANGSLTGYGGGLACKAWLLTHEERAAHSERDHASATARTRARTRSRAAQTSLALEIETPRQSTTSSSGTGATPNPR
jgi:methylated-DNA-[protein]-cysteine S-methyltransferase